MTVLHTAIIPVKSWIDAKSRLDLTAEIRGELARAFAEDVLRAVIDTRLVGRVVVVSSAPGVDDLVRRRGAHLLADPETDGDRLNASISAGAAWAAREHPREPVVVVPADLPCLTGRALAGLLDRVAEVERALVPDAGGDGTTLLLGADPARLAPGYGVGSAARHVGRGHMVLHDVDPGLRRDVDSLTDLAEALLLGVGPSTDAVVRRHALHRAGRAPIGTAQLAGS